MMSDIPDSASASYIQCKAIYWHGLNDIEELARKLNRGSDQQGEGRVLESPFESRICPSS